MSCLAGMACGHLVGGLGERPHSVATERALQAEKRCFSTNISARTAATSVAERAVTPGIV